MQEIIAIGILMDITKKCLCLTQCTGEPTQYSSRKFYIGRNNKKVDSIETGRIVIYLLPLSDLEKCIYTMLF